MNELRPLALGLILGFPLLGNVFAAEKPGPAPKEFFVYFGTYTGPKSKGIYRSRLDFATGRLAPAEVAAACDSPSFLAVHPNGKILYAIDESSKPATKPGRGVSAFAIDPAGGGLTFLNEQSVGGPGPCHLAVDHDSRCVLVANYSGGSVAAISLQRDGRLGAPGTFVQHTGSSVNPSRQKQPHAHSVTISPDNRFVFAADLGTDQVLAYRLEAARSTLTPNDPPFIRLPPGSGPRHFAFHPGGKFAYVINEMACTVSAFRYDAVRGALADLQNISTLPPGETVKSGYSTAEVVVHPNGRFLFGSNRGHNTIVIFAVDAATGRLTLVEHQPTQGKSPRNFALDPTGTWLFAANQDSDTVVGFRIDPQSGRLFATGQSLAVPSPVCVTFVRAK